MITETFDISELFDQYTDRSLLEEGTRKDTLVAGEYQATLVKVEPRLAGDKSPFKGRKMLNLRFDLKDADGKRISTQFVEISPEEYRSIVMAEGQKPKYFKPGEEGYSREMDLDKSFKLWSQLTKVVNPAGLKMSAGEIVKSAIDANFTVYVTESFRDEEKQYHRYKKGDLEKRKEYLAAGYTGYNGIATIGKPK